MADRDRRVPRQFAAGPQADEAGQLRPAVIGIYPVILDEDGQEVPDGKAGNICITNPWPGIMQTVWGQPERFISVVLRQVQPELRQQGLA